MSTHEIIGNPSQIMVEQLAASGVRFVFNNPGSLEALFFDALHADPRAGGPIHHAGQPLLRRAGVDVDPGA